MERLSIASPFVIAGQISTPSHCGSCEGPHPTNFVNVGIQSTMCIGWWQIPEGRTPRQSIKVGVRIPPSYSCAFWPRKGLLLPSLGISSCQPGYWSLAWSGAREMAPLSEEMMMMVLSRWLRHSNVSTGNMHGRKWHIAEPWLCFGFDPLAGFAHNQIGNMTWFLN